MRVLIIGGTRFMGPLVVKGLASQGHEVAVFHRGNTNTDLPEHAVEILGDRNRIADFAPAIRNFHPDVVLDMMLLNEKQAKELVALVSGFAHRLVVASSCDVYFQYDLLRGVETGPIVNAPLAEEAPLRRKIYPYREQVADQSDPMYDYDKILVERTVMSQPRLPGTVLRLPVVYGPGDYRHRFYEHLRRMKDNRPAIMIDQGNAELRITKGYCENCGAAILKAVVDERAAGRIFNVGEQATLTEREWIGRLAAITGWKGEIVALPEEKLPKHLKTDMNCRHHLVIDTTRLRQELEYKESIDSGEALRRTVDWELSHPPEKNEFGSEYQAEDEALAGTKDG